MNKPVPEKFQRQARLRRLRQQFRDGRITQEELVASVKRTEKDYRKKP